MYESRRMPVARENRELPGQALVRLFPWIKSGRACPSRKGEGYVAVQYLSPFTPQFLVRQESYMLPILHYKLASGDDTLVALRSHIAALKQQGITLWTLRDLRELVLAGRSRRSRCRPKAAVLYDLRCHREKHSGGLAGIAGSRSIRDVVSRTSDIGIIGITEENRADPRGQRFRRPIGGHTGDDLRSLTNAQMQLELQQSRVLLEEMTGKSVFAIGYAIGGVNERVMQLAGEAGYLFGLGAAPDATFGRNQFLRLPSSSSPDR